MNPSPLVQVNSGPATQKLSYYHLHQVCQGQAAIIANSLNSLPTGVAGEYIMI
jgi:hypothetical protein